MNQIDGPRDESIKEPEQLLMQCARVPAFDAMCPDQERLAMEFCQEISGLKGKPGRMPDPARLLEMAESLYLAECGTDCSSSINQGCAARLEIESLMTLAAGHRNRAEEWKMHAEVADTNAAILAEKLERVEADVAAGVQSMRELETANKIVFQARSQIEDLERQLDDARFTSEIRKQAWELEAQKSASLAKKVLELESQLDYRCRRC